MEEFIFAAQRADLRFQSIGEDQESVVVKQVRYRIQIVGVVICIGILNIYVGIFQFNEQQRNAIDKAHNVCAAAVEISMNFQFPNGQEVVLIRVQEVNYLRTLFLGSASRTFDGERNSVPDQAILCLVDLQ